MEKPHVSTVFLRVLSEYSENAFVSHRQVVTQKLWPTLNSVTGIPGIFRKHVVAYTLFLH